MLEAKKGFLNGVTEGIRFSYKGKNTPNEDVIQALGPIYIIALAYSLKETNLANFHPQAPVYYTPGNYFLVLEDNESSIFDGMPEHVAYDLGKALQGKLIPPGVEVHLSELEECNEDPHHILDGYTTKIKELISDLQIPQLTGDSTLIPIDVSKLGDCLWKDTPPMSLEVLNDVISFQLYLAKLENIDSPIESMPTPQDHIIQGTEDLPQETSPGTHSTMLIPSFLMEELFIHATINAVQLGKLTEPQDIDNNFKPIADITILISALSYLREGRNALSMVFKTQPAQIIYPNKIQDLHSTFHKFVGDNSQEFQVDESETSIFKHLRKASHRLQLSPGLKRLFLTQSEIDFDIDRLCKTLLALKNNHKELEIVQQLREANPLHNSGIRQLKRREALIRTLSKTVIGQPQAINSVVDSWFSSSGNGKEGPRLILTFAGVSGVGKSLLARSLTDALNEIEETDYRFSEFSMAQYNSEKQSAGLFGAGAFFSNQPLGSLTKLVRSHPRYVLLFDEIEKAHSSVLSSLLSLLDTGYETDLTAEEEVDFSQVIVIFTTNIGQNELSQNHSGHNVNVFDVLRLGTGGQNTAKMPPELVNRLSKGAAAVFEELNYSDLASISRQLLSDHSEVMPGLKILWPEGFEYNLIKLTSPEINIRRLPARIKTLSTQIIASVGSQLDPELDELTIKLKTQDNITTLHVNCSVHILSSETGLINSIKEAASINNCNTFDFNSFDTLCDKIKSTPPQIVLIDISLMGTTDFEIERNFKQLSELNSNIKVFSFSTESKTPDAFVNNLKLSTSLQGHFELSNSRTTPEQMYDKTFFIYSQEKEIKQLNRQNLEVEYQILPLNSGPSPEVELLLSSTRQSVNIEDINNKLFQRSVPKERLSDVVGLERAKSRLTDVLTFLKQPELFSSHGTKPPTGYLLAGDPGTGKTMLAKAVAGESQLPFFTLSAGDLMGGKGSNPVEIITELFSKAKKYAPSIVFIDEIDVIARSRSDGGNAFYVNTLLTEMDGFEANRMPVFVLAATNYPERLDPALTRPGRFDETIYCDHPNYEARLRLLNLKFKGMDIESNDLDTIAKDSIGLSAAQIDQLFRETNYAHRIKSTPLSYEFLHKILIQIRFGNPSEVMELNEETKRETAYHEAGHLIASKLLMPEIHIDYVTIEPRDQSLGFVAFRPEIEHRSESLERIKKRLIIALAGRAAEYLLYNDRNKVSSGASQDIRYATALVTRAVFESGMSEELPPISIPMLAKYHKGELAQKAESIATAWIVEAEEGALELLRSNWELLDRFAKDLMTAESMTEKDIGAFF